MDAVTFVVGPTAVGKSDFAIGLAKKGGGEIVSADSMQVYKGFDLGTAKPSVEARRGVPHHMIDVADPMEDYSAAAFSQDARQAIKGIIARGKTPIVCGGSGLYVHALLYEMDFSGRDRDEAFRAMLLNEAEEKGAAALYARLLEADPFAAEQIHPNNTKRVVRALERACGEIESAGLREFENTFEAKKRRYKAHIIRLNMDRAALYRRIELRVDEFFGAGLVGEVEGLLAVGVPRDCTAMQGIGYKEVAAMLAGEYDGEEALRLVKRNTRRLAKRQETWFKRYTDAETISF